MQDKRIRSWDVKGECTQGEEQREMERKILSRPRAEMEPNMGLDLMTLRS